MNHHINHPSAPGNGASQKSTSATHKIRPHWKLQWLLRMTRLKNAGKFPAASVDMALAVAESFYEKPLAEVSCSFLAIKTGLSKRWAVHAIGELERTPDTIIVRVRGQWEGRIKSKYAIVLTPEDLGLKDAAELGVTGPVASDELWVNGGSPTRVNERSPTRVIPGSPNNTNSPKLREGEVVSDAGARAPNGACARVGESTVSDRVASGDARAMATAFATFWEIYPRKEGRAAARKEFEAAVARDVPVDTIIDGAERYKAAKANVDSNWLKFPATWLRDECWLEDPKPPRPKPERAAKAGKAKKGKRMPRVSKGNSAAEPVEPDDDGEMLTPEEFAEEAGFPIGTHIWDRASGYKGEVLRVEKNHDDRVKVAFLVVVRWDGVTGFVRCHADALVFEPPFTAEEMAERRAEMAKREAEARAAREAEQEKRDAEWRRQRLAQEQYEETLARFPIGSHVRSIYDDDRVRGEVLEISGDEIRVAWGRWRGDTCDIVSVGELMRS